MTVTQGKTSTSAWSDALAIYSSFREETLGFLLVSLQDLQMAVWPKELKCSASRDASIGMRIGLGGAANLEILRLVHFAPSEFESKTFYQQIGRG